MRYREQQKREDRRAGEVVAILFNINRDPKKSEGIDWQDVFPEWKQSGKVQTDDEMYGTMIGWTMMTKHLPSGGGGSPINIAELFVRIRGDTTDVSRKVKGVQRDMDSLGAAATKMFGILGVGFGLRAFIQNTVEAQNAVAQLNAVIKSTGGAAGVTQPQLSAMAGELQKVSTFSDEAIMGAQGLLLTFTKIKGATLTDATKAVLDLATAMGGDLKGAAIQVGKALHDPTIGLTALRRSGVSFSQAQTDVIKNLFATGRAAEAQQMILAELRKEFGGSAEAARNTLGGALTALKNAFSDTMEVSQESSTGIVGAINAMADAMPGLRSAFASFFGGLDLMMVDASIRWQKFLNLFRSSKDKISGSDLEALRTESTRTILGLDQPKPPGAKTPTAITGDVKAGAATKAAGAALQASQEYWRGQNQLWEQARDKVNDLKEEARQYLLDNPVSGLMPFSIPEVSMPNVGINDSVTKEQRKSLEKMGIFIDDANKNSKDVQGAIWGSANQLANTLVSALNIGGGGKGSNLGGAIGGTAGFALGYAFGGGPVGGAIGSLIGNIGGSLLGGLFDSHKKEVNANTQALRALTSEIHHMPSGFRINEARYNATDVSKMGEAARRYTSRGGANPLLVGT